MRAMKALSFLLILFSSMALAEENFLGSWNFVNLSVDAARVQVDIPYPGTISHVCGVEVAPSLYWVGQDDLKTLADALKVSEGLPWSESSWTALNTTVQQYGRSLRYNLVARQTYVTWVRVETKSGESLDSLFKRVIHNRGVEGGPVAVVLRPIACQ